MFGEFLSSGANITKGLWHLNGNITDSSGNGQTGTATNVTWVNDGLFGQCASFSSTAQSRILGDNNASLSMTSITAGCWFKTNTYPGFGYNDYYAYFFNFYKNSNAGNFGLSIFKTYVTLGIYKASPLQHDQIDVPITTEYDNKWHNYIGTYSNGYLKLYYDGVRTGIKGPTYAYEVGGKWAIGTNDNYFTYNGLIDEVFVENYEWSAEQIKKYYTYSKGRFGI